MEVQGYPPILILVVLGAGTLLAIARPYYAFLFGLLLFTCGSMPRFNQTRLPGLGPFLNLGDACLLVIFAAFFFDRVARRKPIWVPPTVGLLLFVLILAVAQSFWKLGWTYETLRAFRWALDLPIGIFLGANLVTSARRTSLLIGTLLLGSILSAGQHVAFAVHIWRTMSLSMENYTWMRTIGYGGFSSTFLLTAVVWDAPRALGKRVLWLSVGLLFLGTQFLNMTRSLWLAIAGTVPCLLLLFRVRCPLTRVAKLGLLAGFIGLFMAFALRQAMPGLDVQSVLKDRAVSLLSADPRHVTHTGTRRRAFEAETREWWKGTLIFGRGLDFYRVMDNPDDPRAAIAFGHLGYVTYLSQLGLIGLVVYGVYFPLSVIRDGRLLWYHGDRPAVQYLGLLGAASIICGAISFLMSSSFLGAGSASVGMLYGSVWSMARLESDVYDGPLDVEVVDCARTGE